LKGPSDIPVSDIRGFLTYLGFKNTGKTGSHETFKNPQTGEFAVAITKFLKMTRNQTYATLKTTSYTMNQLVEWMRNGKVRGVEIAKGNPVDEIKVNWIHKTVPDNLHQEILELNKAGIPYQELSEAYDVPYDEIRRIVNTERNKTPTPVERA